MASTSKRKPRSPAGKPPAEKPTGQPPAGKRPAAASRPLLPGSTLLWVLLAVAVVWFAGRLWALRGTLRAAVEGVELGTQAITPLITFGLPTVISAAMLVGAAVGLAARVLLADRLASRWTVPAGALLAAVLTGGAVYGSGYGTAATVGVAAAAILG
ncbi:MAG: hypothetical protein ACRDT6_23240, partial [Micromonosporaceae bacterium]